MTTEIRALSIKQPWASLIVSGRKTLEVRSWSTPYRGTIIVCASAQPDRVRGRALLTGDEPLGVAVGVVRLVDVREGRAADTKNALVDPTGHLCWVLDEPVPACHLVAVKGKLGLWRAPLSLLQEMSLSACVLDAIAGPQY